MRRSDVGCANLPALPPRPPGARLAVGAGRSRSEWLAVLLEQHAKILRHDRSVRARERSGGERLDRPEHRGRFPCEVCNLPLDKVDLVANADIEDDPHDVESRAAWGQVVDSQTWKVWGMSHSRFHLSRKRKQQAAALLVLVIPILAALVKAWQ